MLKPDDNIPDKWIFERIDIPMTYAKCPVCGFSFSVDRTQALPYFCGGCGADMRKGGADMQNTTETPSSCTTTNPNSVEAYHQSLKGDAE